MTQQRQRAEERNSRLALALTLDLEAPDDRAGSTSPGGGEERLRTAAPARGHRATWCRARTTRRRSGSASDCGRRVQKEFRDRVEPEDLAEARDRLGHWFARYNPVRPHQEIDGLVPADRFFGAEALRTTMEARLARDELLLALEEMPRRSLYLFGQVGDQQLSLVGERALYGLTRNWNGRSAGRHSDNR